MKDNIEKKYKNFVKLLEFSNGKYHISDVFRDFVIIFAISIQNGFYYRQDYEDLYLQIIRKYNKDEQEVFFKLVGELNRLLTNQNEIKDVLGEIYSQIGTYLKQYNQFFTPNHIAKFIAKSQLFDIENIKKKDIITINDSACGSGVLLLAAANELNLNKIDYKNEVLFVAQDIDIVCVCMTYIQMAFYKMSGIVIQGNTLLNEQNRIFYTPQYIIKRRYEKDIFNSSNKQKNKNEI